MSDQANVVLRWLACRANHAPDDARLAPTPASIFLRRVVNVELKPIGGKPGRRFRLSRSTRARRGAEWLKTSVSTPDDFVDRRRAYNGRDVGDGSSDAAAALPHRRDGFVDRQRCLFREQRDFLLHFRRPFGWR